jgi:cell division protein FtsI (penicillin-binding protein 3)
MNMMSTQFHYPGRRKLMLVAMAVAGLCLVWRVIDLQVVRKDFLQDQGDARYLREVTDPAHRGMITDRNGEPLAISTPVDSVWANPQELINVRESWPRLAKVLGIPRSALERLLASRRDKEFVYLKRQVTPDMANKVMALKIPGVDLAPEYKRYYPSGEVAAHVVGFANVDDVGQEGIELQFNNQLKGVPGIKRVIKDRYGRIVENVERVSEPRPGKNITLSIDRRLQYLAYRELKKAVKGNRADAGSLVMLDAHTGEVLAMVNQPSYNPNNRGDLKVDRMRNRAVTDVFEPGSTIKPFTIAAALQSGLYTPDSIIDTRPGLFRIGRQTIHDHRNYGLIDVSTVIKKSSNVGASKIALSMPSRLLWNSFVKVGLGEETGSGFPGESVGLLSDYGTWHKIQQATISYGYGLSVTALQLARAYTALATNGRALPVSFLKRDQKEVDELRAQVKPVFSKKNIHEVRAMLESVVSLGGTGTRASVSGYRIAGKTGTVKKSGSGGYIEDSYIALFAGMAPASNPRLVMVVVINNPHGEEYYGGLVAAPVFSAVMAGALRMLDIPPDDLKPTPGQRLALLGGAK